MRDEFTERYVVHGRINFVMVSASMFADFYTDTFAPEDPTETYQLLQGFHTRSVEAGRGLWDLSRIVQGSALRRGLFETRDTATLVPELERNEEGWGFLEQFRSPLDEFGWRSDVLELTAPTWREDLTSPLNTLQGYVHLDSDADPDVRLQEAVQTGERLLAQARDRLTSDDDKLARFNELYEMACHYLKPDRGPQLLYRSGRQRCHASPDPGAWETHGK